MTREEITAIVTTWAKHGIELDDEWRKWCELIPGQETVLHDKCWNMFDSYLELVAKLTGIHSDSLDWFANETRFGRKPMESRLEINGKTVTMLIDSIEKFLEFEFALNENLVTL